jgi:DNA-3-methyladenine glycosylase
MVLEKDFFQRSTLLVAQELLGQYLCRKMLNGNIVRYMITELEAYDGPEDKACHAAKGRTARTDVMFWPGGVWYIYLCYGIHWMINIVTGPKDYPAALLIRGAGIYSGPGRLTKALHITQAFNKLSAVKAKGLWLEASNIVVEEHQYQKMPRVGIDYAGPYWKEVNYRLILKHSFLQSLKNLNK